MCSKFCVKKLCVAFNALQTVVGCLIGIAGFIAFFFVFKNYHAALWSMASAVFAACCLHLHLLYLRKKLQDWYTNRQLESIQSFGLVIFLASVVAFGVYISLAIVKQQSYTLEGFSYYPASTFTALNLYWSFSIFCFCHCYQRKITASNPALLSGVKVHPDSDVES